MVMQTQALAIQASGNADTAPSTAVPPDFALTENQMAELRESWIQHQVNPVGDNERRGVPYSPLND